MANGRIGKDGKTTRQVLEALDDMEPDLRYLEGMITAFQIFGEAGDSIEPIAVSSLARCAHETLRKLEENWRVAISAVRES